MSHDATPNDSDMRSEDDFTDEEASATFDEAVGRVTYSLTFDRTPEPRKWNMAELLGPSLPDVYGEGRSSGDWAQFPPFLVGEYFTKLPEDTDWFGHFLSAAV